MPRKRAPAPIYQLKITLRGSKPPIWRRVLVPGRFTLGELHLVIQAAMGWGNCHLHEFAIGKQTYSASEYSSPPPNFNFPDNNIGAFLQRAAFLASPLDENQVTLAQLFPKEKMKFRYIYDFGDDWVHNILVEKILPPDPEQERELPRCIKGKRACPPEDIGGIWRYAYFLEAIQDPKHPDHKMFVDWIRGFESEEETFDESDEKQPPCFDSEHFDLDEVNRRLANWNPYRPWA